ncbi:MAG: FIST C-terminal domain-containing protein [Sedimenticola sp.]|nr:FIST C-terminal domain-containing protein [Sedimenticola sp.]
MVIKDVKIDQLQWKSVLGWRVLHKDIEANNSQLVLVFGSRMILTQKGEELLNDLRSMYPKAIIAGCSTAGEIHNENINDDSLVATAVYFEKCHIESASISGQMLCGNDYRSGSKLAKSIKHCDLAHVMVLANGSAVNGSELIRGIYHNLPKNIAVTGGLAGDGDRFDTTIVFLDSIKKKSIATIIGFYGKDLAVGFGSQGGWDSFGPKRVITRAEGNLLYELDGQPALDIYEKYLGDYSHGLPATGLLFPINVELTNCNSSVVRTLLAIDSNTRSVTFAGDVPEGANCQLMKGNLNRLVDGSMDAAFQSVRKIQSSEERIEPQLAILISCVGRKMLLKQRTVEELKVVRNVVGEECTLAGFYSYGEIAPHNNMLTPILHNQTMTITTLSENNG